MPNIEIHGLERKEAETLRERMFKEFEGESFLGEVVITICPDTVRNAEGKDQPFLRLIDETGEIIRKLGSFGLNVEYIMLEFFYPKDYLKEEEK